METLLIEIFGIEQIFLSHFLLKLNFFDNLRLFADISNETSASTAIA